MKKTKMIIAAWAGIIASGCGGCAMQPDWRNLPDNMPAVGRPVLHGDTNQPDYYFPTVAVCNRSPYTLKAQIQIESGISEMPNTGRVSALTAPSCAFNWIGIGRIPKQRTKPVLIKVQWQRGSETGGYTHTISIEETSQYKGEIVQKSQSVRR